MRVELLVVPGCPNEHPGRRALQEAADRSGVEVAPVTVTVIDSAEMAQQRGFADSLTC